MRYFIILLFLTSCSSIEFDKDYLLKHYSKEELEFFRQVGFYDGKKISKWVENIKITFVGSAHDGDIELVDSIINEIRPLVAPITIVKVDNDGNLKINFVDKVEEGLGNQQVKLSFFNGFKYSDINLPNGLKGTLRQATLRHEFLHALGLHHPSKKFTGTLIESLVEFASIEDHDKGNVINYKYSELDKRMVKLLYDSKIAKGVEKKDYLLNLDMKE